MSPGKDAVVSVSRSRTAVYDKIDFKGLVRDALDLLEAQGVAVPSSGTVFIKPNLVIGRTARESVTTEPGLVAGLIELLKERGVEEVWVGDSSASYIPASSTLERTGMAEAVLAAGGKVVDIDRAEERVEIDLPGSDILARLTVPRKAREADCLINFTKLKTHRVANSLTCAVKNWVGFLDQKVRLENHQTRLPKLVAELHRALPADLHLADALIVGEGDGPDFCQPRFLGLLLGANDPVALDSIAAELLSVPKGDLLFSWTAFYEGIGQIQRNRIRLVGPDIQDLAIRIEKPVAALNNRFPGRVVLGGVCDGCFAWFMGPAIAWEGNGTWDKIKAKGVKPTFMLGFNARDLNFEEHLQEGPYFVVGDCTPPAFQEDPRTVFISGCCPGPDIPGRILETLEIKEEG